MIREVASLESMLYGNYIKYDRLMELTYSAFKGSSANNINIYIDLYSILSPLYSRYDQYNILNYSIVTSSIINLCAHLRHLYRNRYNVESKIFLMYGTNTPDYNRSIYYGYNKSVADSIVNNEVIRVMINQNIPLLETLCQYLPDIFFIKTDWEIGVGITDIIKREELKGNDNPNIIYTKDQYLYQLTAMLPNTALFRVKKHNGEDISSLVVRDNCFQAISMDKRDVTLEEVALFNPELTSLLSTLSNLPSRGIKSLFSIFTALRLLNQAITERIIPNSYCTNPGIVYDYITNNGRLIKSKGVSYTREMFINRYNAIDIYSQYIIYSNSPTKIVDYDINLYDPESVKDINNRYFRENPLDLNRL